MNKLQNIFSLVSFTLFSLLLLYPTYSLSGGQLKCAYDYPVKRCQNAGWFCVSKSECSPNTSVEASGTFNSGATCNCTADSPSMSSSSNSGDCLNAWEGNKNDVQAASFCLAACSASNAGNTKAKREYCGLLSDFNGTSDCSSYCP